MSSVMIGILIKSFFQTLEMVFLSGSFAVIFGLPLGVLLFTTKQGQIMSLSSFNRIIGFLVNLLRSVPFFILMVSIIPFTRLLVGTSIGTSATIVPLTIAAIPFVARLVESAIKEVPGGLIEAAEVMGASPWQIIFKVLVPEAMPGIVRAITLTLVTLVGYSAMAGVVGGGGLGDVAIQYGYQRFEVDIMCVTVLLLVSFVQAVQWLGDLLARYLAHER